VVHSKHRDWRLEVGLCDVARFQASAWNLASFIAIIITYSYVLQSLQAIVMDALISVEHIEVSMLQSVEYWVMQSRPMARFLHKDRLGAMKQHIDWKGLWYTVHIFDFLLLLRTPAISEQIHGKTYSKTISGCLQDQDTLSRYTSKKYPEACQRRTWYPGSARSHLWGTKDEQR
jgi:hypothetical protein